MYLRYSIPRLFLVLLSLNLLYSMELLAGNANKNPEKKKKGRWISLFDGRSLKGWHLYNKSGAIKNWSVEDGNLVCHGFKGASGSGDIISDEVFENFELEWEWKVSKGSNSGVFYHVVEDEKYKRASETAPEYQIIDDLDYSAKLEEWQKSGADYAMYAPNNRKTLNSAGEWNSGRIIFNRGNVEYWLNGKQIITFEAWSDDWEHRKTTGKWKDYPDYGKSAAGAIGLQDHGNKAYFRKIRIRRL